MMGQIHKLHLFYHYGFLETNEAMAYGFLETNEASLKSRGANLGQIYLSRAKRQIQFPLFNALKDLGEGGRWQNDRSPNSCISSQMKLKLDSNIIWVMCT